MPNGFPAYCDGLDILGPTGTFASSYTHMGQPVAFYFNLNSTWNRDRTNSLDEFGLPLTTSVSTDEEGSFSRGFAYTRDLAAGTATRVGPDGVETFVQYDQANRVQSVRRGAAAAPIMTAHYGYYDDDRVHTVTFGNDASIEYLYDNARRLTSIKHLNRVGAVILRQDYGYDDRDLPTSISESNATGVVASTTFEYDARGRLYYENRSGQNPYKFDYSYDLGGNRLTKVDYFNLRTTVYHYDIEDPCRYESNNNRLEYYEVIDTAAEPDAPVSTTYYYYTKKGNVERVVTNNESNPTWYTGYRLGYAHNGQAMTHVVSERWEIDNNPQTPECPMPNWSVQYVREFRYDGARQRYAVIEHDAAAYMNNGAFVPLNTKWTDYDGDEPYGDFTVTNAGNPSTIADARSFEPGLAKVDPFATTHSGNTAYYHGDMIGTTRLMSDAGGAEAHGSSQAFTAFGERISGAVPTDGTRYGYAGAWGYQEQSDFPFLHVGARYYDPSTGRFIQRDPIGLLDGTNLYEYAHSAPSIMVDSEGLGVGRENIRTHDKKFWEEVDRKNRENPGPNVGSIFLAKLWKSSRWVRSAYAKLRQALDDEVVKSWFKRLGRSAGRSMDCLNLLQIPGDDYHPNYDPPSFFDAIWDWINRPPSPPERPKIPMATYFFDSADPRLRRISGEISHPHSGHFPEIFPLRL